VRARSQTLRLRLTIAYGDIAIQAEVRNVNQLDEPALPHRAAGAPGRSRTASASC